MNAYDYAPLRRPPSYATLPSGWELIETGRNMCCPGRKDLPFGNKPFGVVRYRRPLSTFELEQYELEPVGEDIPAMRRDLERYTEALRAIADPEHCLTRQTVDGLRRLARSALNPPTGVHADVQSALDDSLQG